MSELAGLLKDGPPWRWRRRAPSLPILGEQADSLIKWLATGLEGAEHSSPVDFASLVDFGLEAVSNLGFSSALQALVGEFNALRSDLLELAGDQQIMVDGSLVLCLNRLLDEAMATAVKALADHHNRRREEALATAVHDLRTPLTALSLATSLLERLVHPVPESDERALLDIMRLNVEKQASLFQRVFA